ncbi:MAG: hypothetical protein E7040_03145 [Lentisphaerae bacterium]|nr:hypothetical protein [Lentisphaerota bacterium]
MSRYDDVINLPHHVSPARQRMSMHDRAAQFAPAIDFSDFCATFPISLFLFLIVCFVVIIINHRNRLFTSHVF